jgi:Putative metallopeptidase domain
MKFTKIIGQSINPKTEKTIEQCREKLTACIGELALDYNMKNWVSNIGGDILIFNLLMGAEQICDITAIQSDEIEALEQSKIEKEQKLGEELRKKFNPIRVLRTAATNGKQFFYNPEFIVVKSLIGVRLILNHEAMHGIYTHSSLRSGRLIKLWNIAVDYKVNFNIMKDLKTRGIYNPTVIFKENLGDYITLSEYRAFLRDPYNPPKRLFYLNPIHNIKSLLNSDYKHPGDKAPPLYFAENDLAKDLQRPEAIYEVLYNEMPRCAHCNRIPCYNKRPNEYNKLVKELKEKQEAEKKK